MIGNWINYFLFIAIIVTGLLFYNNYLLFLMLIIIMMLPVISIAVLYKESHKLSAYVSDVSDSYGKNNDVFFNINLKNDSIFPFGNIVMKISINNGFYKNKNEYYINITNFPKRVTMVKWSCKSEYSGNVIIKIEEMYIQDMLFLKRIKKDLDVAQTICIMPDSYELAVDSDFLAECKGDEDKTNSKSGDDVSEINSIKEYINGDSIQKIHWKVSARLDKLMIKDFSVEQGNYVEILLNLYYENNDYDEMDAVIELFVSISEKVISEHIDFSIIYANHKTQELSSIPISNSEELFTSLKQIFYCKPAKDSRYTYELYKSNMVNENYTCLYITGKSNSQEVQGRELASFRNKAVVIQL